jgi:hypothetical protein
MKKLAIIRSTDENPCPYGLEIPFACKTVGGLIKQMTPTNHMLPKDYTEQDKEKIMTANSGSCGRGKPLRRPTTTSVQTPVPQTPPTRG